MPLLLSVEGHSDVPRGVLGTGPFSGGKASLAYGVSALPWLRPKSEAQVIVEAATANKIFICQLRS